KRAEEETSANFERARLEVGGKIEDVAARARRKRRDRALIERVRLPHERHLAALGVEKAIREHRELRIHVRGARSVPVVKLAIGTEMARAKDGLSSRRLDRDLEPHLPLGRWTGRQVVPGAGVLDVDLELETFAFSRPIGKTHGHHGRGAQEVLDLSPLTLGVRKRSERDVDADEVVAVEARSDRP